MDFNSLSAGFAKINSKHPNSSLQLEFLESFQKGTELGQRRHCLDRLQLKIQVGETSESKMGAAATERELWQKNTKEMKQSYQIKQIELGSPDIIELGRKLNSSQVRKPNFAG